MIVDGMGGLALARLRRRPGQWLSIGGAVVAAVALVGILSGLSVRATDLALARALGRLDPADRAVQVSVFSPSDRDAAAFDGAARVALDGLGDRVAAPVAGVIFNRARDIHHLDAPDIQILAADDLARWTTVGSGRLPMGCSASPCEALLISHGKAADAVPDTVTIAGLELRIVGRGTLTSSLAVGRPDLQADATLGLDPFDTAPDPPPAFLLLEGTRSAAVVPELSVVGRSYRWTAPLDPGAVHPWTVDATTAAIGGMERQLAASTFDFGVRTPADTIVDELALGRTATGRLQLIGALAVAVLIAFAVFAGVVVRADVALELRRIRRAGTSPVRQATFLGLEILVPVAIAAVVGLVVAGVVVELLAAGSTASGGSLLAASVVDPSTLTAAFAIATVAALGVLGGILVNASRGLLVGLIPGLVGIGLILAWQLVAGEGLTDQLVRGALGGPVLILLPAALAFGIVGLCLAIVPAGLRALARRSGRMRLSIRLAILSLARESARPAATLTLLGLSLGALVFTVAYGDTVQRGIVDQAAFETGADLRVAEGGTGLILAGTVVPTGRYAGLGPGVDAWPVLRRTASVAPGGDVTLIGIDPADLPRVLGWRSDFSAHTQSDLATAIALPGDFSMPGHPLAAGASTLAFDVLLSGDPVILHAEVATPDGDFADILLGTMNPGSTHVAQALPAGVVGGSVVALRVSDSLLVAGPAHPGSLGRSTLTFNGLGGLVDDGAPVQAEVGGTVQKVIRAAFPTDGVLIPAIVSPALAAEADAAGTLTLPLGTSVIRVHVAAVASRFPTVIRSGEPFIVAPYAPLLLAINGILPGAGHPDEMWIRTADAATTARVAGALGRAPFRAATVRDRAAIEADRTTDPFAAGLVAALLAAAIAGLALAGLGLLLGIVADLRDERGELADLESQGVPASTLRSLLQARTALLALGGIVAGLAIGVALTALTTSALSLTAGATVPVPELRIVFSWPSLVVIAVVPALTAGAVAAILSRRGRWAANAPAGHAR
jgi:hypothetical protein